jgi:hypothetical protein
MVNSATAGLKEEESCREKRSLPDSELFGDARVWKKSRQPVKLNLSMQ